MDYSSIFDLIGQGTNLYGQMQGAGNAGNINSQVQQQLGQNGSTLAQQIAALQGQIGQGGDTARSAYDQANALYGGQNQQLQSNIDQMTANLNALSDPNSAYMQ